VDFLKKKIKKIIHMEKSTQANPSKKINKIRIFEFEFEMKKKSKIRVVFIKMSKN